MRKDYNKGVSSKKKFALWAPGNGLGSSATGVGEKGKFEKWLKKSEMTNLVL